MELKKRQILLKAEKHTFKVICDPNLPKEQTYLNWPETLKLIFEKVNKSLKSYYAKRNDPIIESTTTPLKKDRAFFTKSLQLSEFSPMESFYMEKVHAYEMNGHMKQILLLIHNETMFFLFMYSDKFYMQTVNVIEDIESIYVSDVCYGAQYQGIIDDQLMQPNSVDEFNRRFKDVSKSMDIRRESFPEA